MRTRRYLVILLVTFHKASSLLAIEHKRETRIPLATYFHSSG